MARRAAGFSLQDKTGTWKLACLFHSKNTFSVSEEAAVIKLLCTGSEEQAALRTEHHKASRDVETHNSHSPPVSLHCIPLLTFQKQKYDG